MVYPFPLILLSPYLNLKHVSHTKFLCSLFFLIKYDNPAFLLDCLVNSHFNIIINMVMFTSAILLLCYTLQGEGSLFLLPFY